MTLPKIPLESVMTQFSWQIWQAQDFGIWHTLLNLVVSPWWYNGRASIGIHLIVDKGALVFILPCQEDFISYCPSNIKTKDLSLSMKVAGEGLLWWKTCGNDGQLTTLELPGYHTPKAKVWLLSPQVLLEIIGGGSIQTATGVIICLGNDITLLGKYCPQSRLTLLNVTNTTVRRDFWAEAFVYNSSITDAVGQQGILGLSNQNLSTSQKETLLWHYCLSHASISWIQLLMPDCK